MTQGEAIAEIKRMYLEVKPWLGQKEQQQRQRQKLFYMSLTTDPNDPRLNKRQPGQQNEVYLVLSEEERAKGFVRPVRRTYRHNSCGAVTTMGEALAETYARQPDFYGATYCTACKNHFPVSEFVWEGTDIVVGS